MFRGLSVCLAVMLAAMALAPSKTEAANKEILELHRYIGELHEMLKTMQQNQDRQMAEIRVLAQQALQAANDTGKAVAVIQSGLQQSLREQENKVVAPVVGLGTRVDQMSGNMHEVQQGLADMSAQISKIQTQLSDLTNAVKVLQAPPPPPPPSAGSMSGGAPAPESAPSISATDLYNNAMRDRSSGKLDLAVQEFSDYLRWYGNTELAPNAQYHIASIHAAQQDYETAVREYDLVLEKYPDNNKTPDALYGKGIALVRLGRKTEGSREFGELIKRFPGSPLAAQSCTQITNLGLRCPSATGSATRSAPKKKK